MRYRIKAGGAALCLFVLVAPTAQAAEDEITQAIDRGVTFLKGLQRGDGTWPHGDRDSQSEVGATALAGLTLLECGVPASDPAVERAAAVVRRASIALTHTYSLSLAVMFLDRLGDANDEPLIQSMAVRLLGGQNDQGGWTYHCPQLDENEQRRLSNLKPQRSELVGRADLPQAGKTEAKPNQELPKEIKDQLARLNNRLALGGAARAHPADNSNTQFAALGLWVARRHGIPVERELARVAARFRLSQAPDGSWHYMSATAPGRAGSGTPAMTCAGLLGLAVAQGTAQAVLRTDRRANLHDPWASRAKSAANFGKDLAVRSGLIYLATHIGHPNGANAKKKDRAGAVLLDYYYLWSLERVAMIYGLKTIGKKDWYAWGSEILLARQEGNGSWKGKYGGGIDSCFALLFLQRANVARDLSAALSGKVQDPGDVQLKAGGVGGEALLAHTPKPAAPGSPKPAQAEAPAPPVKPAVPMPPREEKTPGKSDSKPVDSGEKKPSPVTPEVKPAPAPVPAAPAVESAEEKEAAQLATQLIQAPHDKQEAIVEKLKERKGVAYTQALALAIPQLKGPNKTKARDALAERLTRMKASTLREELQDENMEIRRAAALACAMKEDKSFVPDLIGMLEDPQRPISFAAHAALKELTGKDFGPAPDASPRDRAGAIARWKDWWKSQGGK